MKLFFNFIFFCLAGYAVVLAVLYFFQEKFLFFPGATPFGDCPGMEKRDANAQVFGTVRYYLQTALNFFFGNDRAMPMETVIRDLATLFPENCNL